MSSTEVHRIGELSFEWDSIKASFNVVKHGASFFEGASVFLDEEARLLDDPDHFDDEIRFVLLGYSVSGRLIATIHTMRGLRVRIISVRPASRTERYHYERRNQG